MSSLLLTPFLIYSFSYVSWIILTTLPLLSSLTNEQTNPICYYTYSRHILPNTGTPHLGAMSIGRRTKRAHIHLGADEKGADDKGADEMGAD